MSSQKNGTSGADLVEKNVGAIREMEQASERAAGWTERAGDGVASFAGTMRFIVLHILWFTIWILLNLGAVRGITPFDPFPFTFLTFCVSLEAILLSSIVLISQKRLGRMSDERASVELQINLLAEQESTETLRLLRVLCEKHGVNVEAPSAVEGLTETTHPSAIAAAVQRHLQTKGPKRPRQSKA